MSVELKIYVEENCDSLYLFDQTGKYDSKCNKNGWCGPNIDISEVVAATFEIYLPKTDDSISIDVFPSLPSKSVYGWELLPKDIGEEEFVSGIWRFDYLVTLKDGTILMASCSKLLKKELLCCMEKKAISADVSNFESDDVMNSIKADNLFLSAEANAKHGNIKEAQEIIDYLHIKCKCKC